MKDQSTQHFPKNQCSGMALFGNQKAAQKNHHEVPLTSHPKGLVEICSGLAGSPLVKAQDTFKTITQIMCKTKTGNKLLMLTSTKNGTYRSAALTHSDVSAACAAGTTFPVCLTQNCAKETSENLHTG